MIEGDQVAILKGVIGDIYATISKYKDDADMDFEKEKTDFNSGVTLGLYQAKDVIESRLKMVFDDLDEFKYDKKCT